MTHGINWVFERSRMSDYQARDTTPPADCPLVRAVAALSYSSPVFAPLRSRVIATGVDLRSDVRER